MFTFIVGLLKKSKRWAGVPGLLGTGACLVGGAAWGGLRVPTAPTPAQVQQAFAAAHVLPQALADFLRHHEAVFFRWTRPRTCCARSMMAMRPWPCSWGALRMTCA